MASAIHGTAAPSGLYAWVGITTIWLMPFQRRPAETTATISRTITGSIAIRHARRLCRVSPMACQQRGHARHHRPVVIHSDQHPWFRDARKSRTRHTATVCLVLQEAANASKGTCFPALQNRHDIRQGSESLVFHRFYDFPPDLNTSTRTCSRDPQIMGFWIQLGVSASRMDAVPFVIATRDRSPDPGEQYDMLRSFREFLQWRQGTPSFSAKPRAA